MHCSNNYFKQNRFSSVLFVYHCTGFTRSRKLASCAIIGSMWSFYTSILPVNGAECMCYVKILSKAKFTPCRVTLCFGKKFDNYKNMIDAKIHLIS